MVIFVRICVLAHIQHTLCENTADTEYRFDIYLLYIYLKIQCK